MNVNRKPDAVVATEISMLREFWKCDPMHYFRYRLYEKNLSYEELTDYIPAFYFYNYHMPSVYDERNIGITESKIRLNEYLSEKKIETPVTVAVTRKCRILDQALREISFGELKNRLLISRSSLFFVKPDKGRGGNGIFTVKKNKWKLYVNGEEFKEEQFYDNMRQQDYIIQEALVQRSDMSALNPTSVNTLRVITQFSENAYRISAVVIRLGRNGAFVDNSAQGGISVGIDIQTGRFCKYAFTEHSTEKFDRHPDTGFVFEGYVIPGWDAIREEILKYAGVTTEFHEVAWDIAVLSDRISVIELNLNYGIDHLQCCMGGMRRRLNINPMYTK